MNPFPQGPDQGDGGVRRVADAMVRYLPEFGWQVTADPQGADLIANHGAFDVTVPGKPMVSHCHGLYWREYDWPSWGDRVNGQVISSMLKANAVTAPSEWVANAIRRGSLINPTVIYHGVDLEEWSPGESLGYVLWNKARVDAISDPTAVAELARRLPSVPFVTTHGGGDLPNVQKIGTTDYTQMRRIVSGAGVYLATVRETFGIGTLEALAAGVPVVGWDFAGQREIFRGSEGGILVPIGDYDALADAITQVLAERRHYGMSGRMEVRERWQWRDKVEQYARLYDQTLAAYHQERPKVSVVITSYNLNRFLPEAYASAVAQADEVIVIDDCGAERAADVLPADATVVRPEKNLGLSGARNYGAFLTTGAYLIFLDADDMLAPNAIDRLSYALDRDPSIHVAYGGLDLVDERGTNRRRNPWPGMTIDFRGQAAHLNQLHYSAMWRREAFIRTGGFRTRDWRAEDASLWLRSMAQGIRVACVTDESTLIYRVRQDSKSQEEYRAYSDRDGDWTHWLPWRAGAKSGPDGSALKHSGGIRLNPNRVPFSAPQPPVGKHAWPVAHHAEPLVSVIIPVGPGHAQYLTDALDSVLAQTVDRWECIVVDDTGTKPDAEGNTLVLPGHPWARIVHGGNVWDADRRMGAGLARNIGVERARAPLVLFLDADDMLTPNALAVLLDEYSQGEAPFVYGDAALWRGKWDEAAEVLPAPEFEQEAWVAQAGKEMKLPAVTMLIETEAAKAVKFDEDLPGWEDGLFYLELAANGYCGRHAKGVTLMYRTETGTRRKVSLKQAKQLKLTIGSRVMAKRGCGCGGNVAAITLAAEALANLEGSPEALAESVAPLGDGSVRIKYTGPQKGTFSFLGKPSGLRYEAGNNPMARYLNAKPEDVSMILSLEGFEVVGR
jgi:glycosyltransferase involved in cell wall biosynthesis